MHPRGSVKMTNREERRLRVGDYRAIYVLNDGERMVTILQVVH